MKLVEYSETKVLILATILNLLSLKLMLLTGISTMSWMKQKKLSEQLLKLFLQTVRLTTKVLILT